MAISEQKLIKDIERLINNSCANYMDGLCLPKDKPCIWREIDINPDTGKQYPFADKGITCPWLRKAVLPGNKGLFDRYAAWEDHMDGKRSIEAVADNCERCRTPIIKASNRQRYCSTCSKDERKKKEAARQRKLRSE